MTAMVRKPDPEGMTRTQGQYRDAKRRYERAIEIAMAKWAPDHYDLAGFRNNMADLFLAEVRKPARS